MVQIKFRSRGSGKEPGVGGKLFLTLFFLFFFGMGSAFEVFVIREFIGIVKTYSWSGEDCTITRSEVVDKSGNNPYQFSVSYSYSHRGIAHMGTVFKKGYSGDDEYHKANKWVNKYPKGSQSTCYVNPKKPQEAILKRGSLLFGFLILFPLIFVLVGLGGIYGTWKKSKPKEKQSISKKAPKSKIPVKVGIVIFFGIFACIGGGMLWPFLLRPAILIIDSGSWEEVPCRILRAQVQSHSSDDGTTYSVDILYEYEYNGRKYKSSRYYFIGGSSSGYSGKQEIVSYYKKAKNPVCYVNPDDPGYAVLKREFSWMLLLGLIPLVFMLVGLGGIIGTIFHFRRKYKKLQWLPDSSTEDSQENIYGFSQPEGQVTLKPSAGPWKKLFGILFFAVFWNGIVSVFVTMVVKGFMKGNPEWFLTLFMIPFVLVGLGVIIFVFYQLLACFNPRCILTLSHAQIPLGGAAELKWQITGNVHRISELAIALIGKEQCTYRRGTKTYTDRSVFYEDVLVKTRDIYEIEAGDVGIVLPENTMHSFEAGNNKILWSLKVHGDIKKWPDIDEEYSIVIKPKMI